MDRVGGQLSESLAAIRGVFANPNLRRIELAFAGSAVGNYAFAVAITIYTFHQGGVDSRRDRHRYPTGDGGGDRALRRFALRQVPPRAGDARVRCRPHRLRRLESPSSRPSGAPAISVYALAVGASVFGAVFRPAEASLVPLVARSPQELTAANVTSSTFDSVGIFVGPALGAFLIAFSGYTAAFTVVAATFAWSAFFVVQISAAARDPHARDGRRRRPGTTAGCDRCSTGFRTIAHEPRLRLLIGLYDAQCFVAGTLGVLIVATAIDVLGIGNAGVGVLQSACGVGAIAGAGVALSLVSRSRLGRDLALGLALWGVPLDRDRCAALHRRRGGRARRPRRREHARRHLGDDADPAHRGLRGRRPDLRRARELDRRVARARRPHRARADHTARHPRRARHGRSDPPGARTAHDPAARRDRRRRRTSRRSRSRSCGPCRSSRSCRCR